MSRCFPFPPPGYEKKARPDDENLLAKEKYKEKKHKKEKKDKEKREGKDKKEKERSDEKHREKKDKKEKHKDKKEKRKDKDKGEKKKTSDEKNITLPPPPLPENLNGRENLGVSTTAEDTTEFKFLFELGKRNREDDRATENHMVQKINLTGQRRSELPNNVVESNTLAKRNEFVTEKREHYEGKIQQQSTTKDMEIDSVKKNLGIVVEKQTEEKEKSSKRKHSSGESKGDKHKDRDREKKSSKSKDKKREKKEKEEKTKEKKPDKDQQQQQQIKSRETGKDSDEFHSIRPSEQQPSGVILGKRKEPEVNGFLHENEIRPNKFPRPATSLSQQIMENGSKAEPSRPAAAKSLPERKGGIVNNHKTNGLNLFNTPQVTADNGKKTESSVWLGTSNKDNKISPSPLNLDNKVPPSPLNSGNPNLDNKVPLSHPVLENGRKLEPCQTASSQGKPGVGVNRKVDKKIQNGINGLTKVQEPVDCPTKPPTRAKENIVEAPPPVKKPPHPDSKYLSQILTVPSVEWSDFDDQEWLFGNKDSEKLKKTSGSSQVEVETPVWAEAIRVESVDITALPYVIPY